MKSLTEIRQTQTIALILSIFLLPVFTLAQEKAPEIDYSIKSNILNPDTLRGDQKAIFKHFIKLSSKEVEEMPPLKVKDEFAKLGIYTIENDRFVDAYLFVRGTLKNHKKLCEIQADIFEGLIPKTK